MGAIFIANVGSRDVQVQGQLNLPKDSRPLGELILSDWDALKADLVFPILVKAFDWVKKAHPQINRILLFASSQEDRRYQHTDTLPFAQVIQRYLGEKYGEKVAQAVEFITITENPADYDLMMRFYADALRTLTDGDSVYLAVTGGTPAMSFMLLWQGVEILQERAHPLYVIQEHAMPISLNIGRRLVVDAILSDLKDSIQVYQYHAALRLLDTRARLLSEALPAFQTVRAVTDYARQRLNFNFEDAQGALLGADRGLNADWSRQVRQLAEDIAHRDEVWLLREVFYTAGISFANGAYADFLGRAFRLCEGLTEFLVKKWAPSEMMEGEGKGRKVSEKWLDSDPAAWEFLEQQNVDFRRGMTRYTWLALADYFAGSQNTRKQIVKTLRRIGELGDYRNQMPFAHGYAGVSLEELKQRYNADRDDEILRNLRWVFEKVTETPPGDNPYDAINALILELAKA